MSASWPGRVCLYERDPGELDPLAALRPVWELRAGAHTLAERVRALWPEAELLFAGRASLEPLWRERSGRSLIGDVEREGTLFLDAALALSPERAASVAQRLADPVRLEVGGRIAGARLPGGGALPGGDALAGALEEASADLAVFELDAPLLRRPWDFIVHMSTLVLGDIALATHDRSGGECELEGVRILGEGRVQIAGTARVDPGTTLDARDGPIAIESDAVVSFNTWLVGPASVGQGTHVLGGKVGPIVGLGPVCRVRGEIAESFVQGFSNKAHDGFIGHSVLGEWVNLGAMTTCSDLKNTYSTIRLERDGTAEDTGLTKLGVFVGDHAKTAIGTLLSSGSSIGVGANVFGFAGVAPKEVPPFAWGAGGAGSYAIDRFLETAGRVATRRGVALGTAAIDRLRAVHRSP